MIADDLLLGPGFEAPGAAYPMATDSAGVLAGRNPGPQHSGGRGWLAILFGGAKAPLAAGGK
jgi:hypothetical protein